MPYPTSPDVSTSYTAFEQSQGDGSFPGQELDVDLANVRASIAATIEFLKGVTRSDGKLGNQTVGREQLATDVLLGFGAPTTWTTGVVYKAANTVFNGTVFYLCNVDHTAGTFSADLAAGRWTALADINASGALVAGNNLSDLDSAAAARTNLGLGAVAQDNTVPVARGGTGATDVAGARTALGATATGTAVFTAADAAAVRVAAGLGTIATQAADAVNIDGGSIDGTVIGGATPAAATFTTFAATNVDVASASEASIELRRTADADTHEITRIVRGTNTFAVQTQDSAGVGVSNDYIVTVGAAGAASHSWLVGNTQRMALETNFATFSVRPIPDANNTRDLGTNAPLRWRTIFLVNAPDVSSDARLKENIADLTETERRAAAKIKARTFNMKDGGQKKIGYIAQEIIEAMASEGLCAFEYGLVSDGPTYGVDMDAINAFRLG